jgi:hypothetical protein
VTAEGINVPISTFWNIASQRESNPAWNRNTRFAGITANRQAGANQAPARRGSNTLARIPPASLRPITTMS